MEDDPATARDCALAGVSARGEGRSETGAIYDEIEKSNMEVVLLEKAPRVAIYAPPTGGSCPGTTRSILALDYAEIPFERSGTKRSWRGRSAKYDWVHLHHEDFTGQYGKFYASYRSAPWYLAAGRAERGGARTPPGFAKVWQHKHAVARRIREYVAQGGFLFAMCSATDTFDIALAAGSRHRRCALRRRSRRIPAPSSKLDFSQTLAFADFTLEMNPLVYEFSDIDMTQQANLARPGERLLHALRFLRQGGSGPDHADPVPRQRDPRVHGADDLFQEVAPEEVDRSSWPRSRGRTRSTTSTATTARGPSPSTAGTIRRTTSTRWATRRPSSSCTRIRPGTG